MLLSLHLCLQVFIAKSGSGLRPLSGFCYTISDGPSLDPLGYPVVVQRHGDPAALGLLNRSLHMLQQITDGVDVGVGQLSLGSGSE